MPIHYLSKYFNSENKSFIEFILWDTKQGYFRDRGCFELSKLTKNPGGSDNKILLIYATLSSSYCVLYISITGVIVLSNEVIIDITSMRVLAHNFIFKISLSAAKVVDLSFSCC